MKKTNLFLLMLIAMAVLPSFKGDDKDKVYDNKTGWIPADFDTRNSVLLVQNFTTGDERPFRVKEHEKVTDEMKQSMKEVYHYKYEFASAEQIKTDPKYADKEKYRYVLACSNSVFSEHYAGGHVSSYSSNSFHLYDRKLDRYLPETGHSAAYVITTFRPTINTIVKFLKELK